jgi:uncharacterized membrane protein YphA (DoxX/SURF4 family)
MLVITLLADGDEPWQKHEFALLYLFPFITLLLSGGGRYSIDALIR